MPLHPAEAKGDSEQKGIGKSRGLTISPSAGPGSSLVISEVKWSKTHSTLIFKNLNPGVPTNTMAN